MAIQTVMQQLQAQQSQGFTPQVQTSRIAEALIAAGPGANAPLDPAGFGSVATQLSGAVAEKRAEERREKEKQQLNARIAEALAPSTLLPGAAGLRPVTEQDLPPIPTGLDPSAPLNREAALAAEERRRSTAFTQLRGF